MNAVKKKREITCQACKVRFPNYLSLVLALHNCVDRKGGRTPASALLLRSRLGLCNAEIFVGFWICDCVAVFLSVLETILSGS